MSRRCVVWQGWDWCWIAQGLTGLRLGLGWIGLGVNGDGGGVRRVLCEA